MFKDRREALVSISTPKKGISTEEANRRNKFAEGKSKLVIYMGAIDKEGNSAESQVISPDLSKFTPSFGSCRDLAQAIAGNRKVNKFEMI